MGRRERNGWRWLITALAIGATAVGLGAVLRAQNLGAAANVAQLLSLLPLVGGMLAWARERHKTFDAPEDVNKTLNDLIDTIEERVARVEKSMVFRNALRSGLLEMLDRLTSSISQLTGERRSLRDRIGAGHPDPPTEARRRLAELGVRRVAVEVTPVSRPRVPRGAELTEEAGERRTDEILRRVDDVLREAAPC